MTQPDCEERSDVAISSTHSVIARSILCDVAISSFKAFMKKKDKKMRSSRRKAPLRMMYRYSSFSLDERR